MRGWGGRRSAAAPGRPLRLAFAGGGTGGHLVPGLHLLARLGEGPWRLADLVWFTSGRPIEERVLEGLAGAAPGAPVERCVLALEPPGGGAPRLSGLSVRVPPAVRRARAVLRAHGSEVLLGLGGFTAAPAVLAARSLGIPVALLEINASPGRATRALGHLAGRVLHAWPATCARPRGRHVLVGAPVSRRFRPGADPRAAREALGLDPSRPLVCVLGGSQGASALNAFVRAHLSTLLGAGVSVLHQVGPGNAREEAPAVAGYRAVEYLGDVPRALAAADLALCRGGASTLAEVAAMQVPAWVVPYPHHRDRHQERNAEQLGAGARVVPETSLGLATVRRLVALLGPEGAAERRAMASALRARVPADAAGRILDELVALRDGVPPAASLPPPRPRRRTAGSVTVDASDFAAAD